MIPETPVMRKPQTIINVQFLLYWANNLVRNSLTRLPDYISLSGKPSISIALVIDLISEFENPNQ